MIFFFLFFIKFNFLSKHVSSIIFHECVIINSHTNDCGQNENKKNLIEHTHKRVYIHGLDRPTVECNSVIKVIWFSALSAKKLTWLHTHFHYWPNTQFLLAKNFDCFNQKSKTPKKLSWQSFADYEAYEIENNFDFLTFIIAIIEMLSKYCPEKPINECVKNYSIIQPRQKCHPVVQTKIHRFFRANHEREKKNMVGMSVNCMQLVACVWLAICAKRTNYSTILHFIRCNSFQLIWHKRSECSTFCAMDQWTGASGSTVFNGIM